MTETPPTAEPAKLPAPRSPIQSGARAQGIVPTNIQEVRQLANVMVQSGTMGYLKDGDEKALLTKGSQAMMIIMQGLELGLSPMQAVNGITIINGRTCVWGKLARALVLRAGHKIEERIEHEGTDKEKHFCKITRGDDGTTKEVGFGIEDAKRAELWSPEAKVERMVWDSGRKVKQTVENDSPWHRYWPRMLNWRAFGHCSTDVCSDALLGMGLAEEARDVERGRPAEEDRGAINAPPPPPPAAEPTVTLDVVGPAGEPLDDEPPAEAPPAPEPPAPDMRSAIAWLGNTLADPETNTPEQVDGLVTDFMERYDGHIPRNLTLELERMAAGAKERIAYLAREKKS